MSKRVSILLIAAILMVKSLVAQNFAEGIKFLHYEKNKSALDFFKKQYEANPKNSQAVYWYGQAFLANDNVQLAKDLYQKALQDGMNDAWVIVGMSQVEMHESTDINSIKQKWEQAITMSTETKGKNKGKPNAGILNAIGRANAEPDAKAKDNEYAIEKLKLAATLDATNPDILINLGSNYLKLGGEAGGEAVKAFTEATDRDPKNAFAKYRIGSIYYSQGNKDLFEQFFNDAIASDPTFPTAYFRLYDYYSDKDVNKAKEYLDKYIANADKDPNNDFYMAEYLFRARSYKESIAYAQKIETENSTNVLPRLNILYAYNYDKLGDSVQAKSYLDKFFAVTPTNKILVTDYDLAAKVYGKFTASEATLVGYLSKAIEADTVVAHKIDYSNKAADLYEKSKNYVEQLKWAKQAIDLKGKKGEAEFYKLCDIAFKAKDYTQTMAIAKEYIAAFPDPDTE
jgi:tetratricopeptide (TPR) repeat protein